VSVELFRDDDGYTGWLAANVHGYVLNIERSIGRPRSRGRLPDNHRHAATR